MNIKKLLLPLLGIIVVAIIIKFVLPSNSQKPKLSEIKDQVYVLMSELYCEGKQVEIELKKAEIDEFLEGHSNMPINGWPVRLSADVIRKEGSNQYTQKLSLENPSFFVRSKKLGGYEVFLPEEFLEMKQQLEEQLNNALQ